MRVWWVIGCLLVSHGAVLWLGRALPPRGAGGRAPEVVREAPAAAVDPRPSPQEWLRRGREREARVAEEQKRAAKEKESYPGEVEAARQKLAASAADAAALATAGMRGGTLPVSAETAAAFGLWLERDLRAALRELELWMKEHGWQEGQPFGSEIGRFLEAGGKPRLRELLEAVPGLREFVLEAAAARLRERGAGLAAGLLRELDDPGERLGLFLHPYLEVGQFTGHIAAIRREFDDAEAAVFLKHFRDREGVEALLPEIRAAGFPAAALADFEKEFAGRESVPDEERLDFDQRPLEVQVRERLAEPLQRWRLTGTFATRLPDFYDWCDDAGDGRLPAEEVITRAKAALPGAAGLDRDLRLLAFWELIRTSPREAVLMLRNGGMNWPDECSESLKLLPGDEMSRLLREFPLQGSLPRQLRSEIGVQFKEWYRSYPEECAKTIRGFPDAALREQLSKEILEEDKR